MNKNRRDTVLYNDVAHSMVVIMKDTKLDCEKYLRNLPKNPYFNNYSINKTKEIIKSIFPTFSWEDISNCLETRTLKSYLISRNKNVFKGKYNTL